MALSKEGYGMVQYFGAVICVFCFLAVVWTIIQGRWWQVALFSVLWIAGATMLFEAQVKLAELNNQECDKCE